MNDGVCFGVVVVAICVALLSAYSVVKRNAEACSVPTSGIVDTLTRLALWVCVVIGVLWIAGVLRVGMLH